MAVLFTHRAQLMSQSGLGGGSEGAEGGGAEGGCAKGSGAVLFGGLVTFSMDIQMRCMEVT